MICFPTVASTKLFNRFIVCVRTLPSLSRNANSSTYRPRCLSGWRQVTVRERRTKIDWAIEVEELLRTRYASAEKVILICDNLNTHTKGAFYEAFDPETARAIVRRLEFCHTPKHGSWLNVAENELSSMTRQCVTGRRFATIDTLRSETAAWQEHSNAKQRGVDWQFRVDDARIKLKSVYPKIKV